MEINVDKISVLELKGCEDILIEENIINPNDTLIILKVEKISIMLEKEWFNMRYIIQKQKRN